MRLVEYMISLFKEQMLETQRKESLAFKLMSLCLTLIIILTGGVSLVIQNRVGVVPPTLFVVLLMIFIGLVSLNIISLFGVIISCGVILWKARYSARVTEWENYEKDLGKDISELPDSYKIASWTQEDYNSALLSNKFLTRVWQFCLILGLVEAILLFFLISYTMLIYLIISLIN